METLGSIKVVSNPALLRYVRILRRIFDSERDLLSLGLQRRLLIRSGRKSRKRYNKTIIQRKSTERTGDYGKRLNIQNLQVFFSVFIKWVIMRQYYLFTCNRYLVRNINDLVTTLPLRSAKRLLFRLQLHFLSFFFNCSVWFYSCYIILSCVNFEF